MPVAPYRYGTGTLVGQTAANLSLPFPADANAGDILLAALDAEMPATDPADDDPESLVVKNHDVNL